MREDSDRKRRASPGSGAKSQITIWVKICVFILVVLIGFKLLGLQIFIKFEFGDKSILAALTEIETYYIPLGLLLTYMMIAWLWDRPNDD